MNRRNLLSAAAPATLALSGAVIATPSAQNADAELIALCARYVAHTREYCAVGQHTENMPLSHPEYIRCEGLGRAMVPAMHVMEDQITDMPARTIAGLLAKAEAEDPSLFCTHFLP